MWKVMDFCFLLKIWRSTYAINMVQKLLDNAKKSTADAINTALKRAIKKKAEATADLNGNKIADKITSKAKKSNQQDVDIPKEIYMSPEKRQKIIDHLRLK